MWFSIRHNTVECLPVDTGLLDSLDSLLCPLNLSLCPDNCESGKGRAPTKVPSEVGLRHTPGSTVINVRCRVEGCDQNPFTRTESGVSRPPSVVEGPIRVVSSGARNEVLVFWNSYFPVPTSFIYHVCEKWLTRRVEPYHQSRPVIGIVLVSRPPPPSGVALPVSDLRGNQSLPSNDPP